MTTILVTYRNADTLRKEIHRILNAYVIHETFITQPPMFDQRGNLVCLGECVFLISDRNVFTRELKTVIKMVLTQQQEINFEKM